MYKHADKTSENSSLPTVNEGGAKLEAKQENVGESSVQLKNNPSGGNLDKPEIIDNSFKAHNAAQLKSAADQFSSKRQEIIQKKENNTGLPDNLKSGIESISGYSMDDVKVHRNSSKPAQLQAHAYAQGTDIYLAPQQEKHLPHEAWHVVQQKQGRVKPTTQLKGQNINDDTSLEREADVMGAKANNMKTGIESSSEEKKIAANNAKVGQRMSDKNSPVQRISLVAQGDGRYKNIDPSRADKGEKDFYDTNDPSDRKVVEQHFFQMQLLEEEQQRDSDGHDDDFGGGLMMQDQLLVVDAEADKQRNHIPEATAKLSGEDYTRAGKNGMIASSKAIDIMATWTPGPNPPEGHSPDALVGFIQNIFHYSHTADYFFDDGRYAETFLKENNSPVIDSDNDSPWYDPPRTYADLEDSAARQALFGPRDPKKKSPIGVAMMDKPQFVFPMNSKNGGKLYRYGGEINFIAYLMIIEPDGSKATVLEHFEWTFEYAYTKTRRGDDYEKIYADTVITSQGKGPASKKPKYIPDGEQGNAFFEQIPVHWSVHGGMEMDDPNRFPSLL